MITSIYITIFKYLTEKTAVQCIKVMIKNDLYPKDQIMDDKFKQTLKQVLHCLSQSFDKFTPSYLNMFKQLLKLFN